MSRIYGIPDDEVAGIEEEVEKFCELGDAYDRKYSSLSSGMAGRVGFGFTTSLNPQILLMDETLGLRRNFSRKGNEESNGFYGEGETPNIYSLNESGQGNVLKRIVLTKEE